MAKFYLGVPEGGEFPPAWPDTEFNLQSNGITVVFLPFSTPLATFVQSFAGALIAGSPLLAMPSSHAVLSGPAIENISKSDITEVVVTNTIPLSEAAHREPKIKVLSIAGLIGRAIQSIHKETSVSKLFM